MESEVPMGLLDGLENRAAQAMGQGGSPTADVAGGLMQALEQHPGGLQGMMDHMKKNGVDPQAMASGQPSTPQQVGQGLQGSGLVESVAQKAGVSPQIAQELIALVLPTVISHFTQGGTSAPPQGGFAGMASMIAGKFL
jgi:uncharacterized protein YidB (DUF937 family)